jgi:hypothetical protein
MEVEKLKRETETEISFFLTNKRDTITVINRNNIGCNHISVLSNVKLDVEFERKTVDEQKAIDNI